MNQLTDKEKLKQINNYKKLSFQYKKIWKYLFEMNFTENEIEKKLKVD